METVEGNKLIADFMGGESAMVDSVFSDKHHLVYYFKTGNNPNPHALIGTQKRVEDLYYHLKWDWLMPVANKIIATHNQTTYFHAGHLYDEIYDGLMAVNISLAYKAVVEFITWYNTHPK